MLSRVRAMPYSSAEYSDSTRHIPTSEVEIGGTFIFQEGDFRLANIVKN